MNFTQLVRHINNFESDEFNGRTLSRDECRKIAHKAIERFVEETINGQFLRETATKVLP